MKKYPKYKDSGVEWIGEIPSEWNLKRLKFISDIIPSNVDKKSKENEERVYLCNYVDVYKNDFITTDLDFMEATASESQIEKLTLRTGDVIATKDSEDPNDIGIPAFVKKTMQGVVCGYHLTLIRSNDIHLDGLYLYWLIRSNGCAQYFSTEARGVTRYAIGVNAFKNLRLSIPPLHEQTLIANYLDHKTSQIDDLIQKKEQLIELLKEERIAIINQAVTKGLDPNVPMKDSGIEWLGEIPENWEVKKLKRLSNVVLGKMLTNENKGGMNFKPYLRAKNIEWEKVNVSDVKKMWFSDTELNKYRVQKNDILVSEGGEVGRASIWQDELGECYIQNSVHKITCNENYLPQFLLFQFILFGFKGHFDAIVNRICIAHLTKEKLLSINFIAPPINEQIQIVENIKNKQKRLNAITLKTNKEISLLKEYKTALINEVVTGKVDVRDEVLIEN